MPNNQPDTPEPRFRWIRDTEELKKELLEKYYPQVDPLLFFNLRLSQQESVLRAIREINEGSDTDA